jgi:hypothetical protein
MGMDTLQEPMRRAPTVYRVIVGFVRLDPFRVPLLKSHEQYTVRLFGVPTIISGHI